MTVKKFAFFLLIIFLSNSCKDDSIDIVIGKWLKNEKIRRNFMPIDYLFTDQHINKYIFYPQLLSLGNIDNKQYLLPVSFNLPAIVFSNKIKIL